MIDRETYRPIDYTEPLGPADFGYHVAFCPDRASDIVRRDVVNPALLAAGERYGIVTQELPWGQMPDPERPPYVLVVPEPGSLLSPATENYLARLSELSDAKVNVFSAHSFGLETDPGMTATAERIIRARDERLRVNTIYPSDTDALYYGLRTVPFEKVVDNFVCETFRAKCAMERVGDTAAELQLLKEQAAAHTTIDSLRRIFAEYGLWHRAVTDGAVMLPTTERGWLVSQTKTDKTEMVPEDFSLVIDFAEVGDTVRFVGRKIPSSDSPELLVLLEAFEERWGETLMAVHFHHNGVTRGGAFPDRITKNAIEYGRFSSGHEMLYELLLQRVRTGETWSILQDHGVVWLGDSAESFEDFISERLRLVPIKD